MCAKVLILGSGGREHALGWKLKQSTHVKDIIIAPGNAGTYHFGKDLAVDVPVKDYKLLSKWCKVNHVDLVVVGSEVPLSEGIVDVLTENNVACFGPCKNAATIESSKLFSKSFMEKYAIPTAEFKSFTTSQEAYEYIDKCDYDLVVKASGLAAGKGVMVCKNKLEAKEAVNDILEKRAFGEAGNTLVLEERLTGEEMSVLCFSDGQNISVMPCCQDHKQLLPGDLGPNTGGMGAYCPCPQALEETLAFIKTAILQKTIDGLKNEGKIFKGVLYAGLMLTMDGPKVLEFNCRFGDPETQVLMPLLDSDLYTIMMKCTLGGLDQETIEWASFKSAVCIVLVSGGYPGKYDKGKEINGLETIKSLENVHVFEAGTTFDNNMKVTCGGRVLAVTAVKETLHQSQSLAIQLIKKVYFEGCFFRNDIGCKGINFVKTNLTYANSGVDVAAGNQFVKAISSLVKTTLRPGTNAEIGGFGGMFDLKQAGYEDPVLVSGTDGVGTKLLIAQEIKNHGSIGIDLVAMCVNDIITHNAEPLYFLDYFACGKLTRDVAVEVLKGIIDGCRSAGCALIGGETAEMPGMYTAGHYDLAGFAVGAYDKIKHTPLPQISDICEEDVIIGLSSSGLHSNGFSLVRKVVERHNIKYTDLASFSNNNLGDFLLTPTAIYSKLLLPILRKNKIGIKALAHITGGGLWENIPRVLPNTLRAELDANKWIIPPVFGWLYRKGNIHAKEMLQTFNCGIGMILIVEKSKSENILKECQKAMDEINLRAFAIGKISKCIKENIVVRYAKEGFEKSWQPDQEQHYEAAVKAKVAVLISGSGTNMKAIIEQQKFNQYEVCLVISNKKEAKGLELAKNANIPTKTINHKDFKDREEFDMEIDKVLLETNVDIVCLAGFMRLLSKKFTEKWKGHILNIHPSLLPAFKGIDAHEQVLKAGVRVTGCTVHFVTPEMDEGAIIDQAAVKVEPGDDIERLSERVKLEEHKLYPKVINMVAEKQVVFNPQDNTVIWKQF